MRRSIYPFLAALCLCVFAVGVPLRSFAASTVQMPPIENKPFAKHHIVLQLSDRDPFKQTLVLNVAKNLANYYGPDNVDIEIVAFGPGLKLLLADNVNKGRIANLVASDDIRFSACNNTLHAFTKKLGYKPKLNPHAVVVPAGAARIIDLEQHGYTLIKP
ncbi:MAG: DsrE family protein [Gammaproteobacteria bacterium]|jgi:intracellular sulfur oxidation DsrE/DsrF family protein